MTSFSFFKYFDAFELDVNVVNFVYYGKTRMSVITNKKKHGSFFSTSKLWERNVFSRVCPSFCPHVTITMMHWISLHKPPPGDLEFSLNVFTEYSSLKGIEPATSCIRDHDTTAAPTRHH